MNSSYRIENEYSTLWEEDGIINITYKPSLKVTLEVAKKIVEDRHILSNGISKPLIVDIRNLLYADDAARKYLASGDAVKYIIAGALIADNPIPILLANLFMLVNAPPVPTKAFRDRKKAVQWLQKYR